MVVTEEGKLVVDKSKFSFTPCFILSYTSQLNLLIFFKDPFNCSDSCHLAWLIRDQRNLLKRFSEEYPPRCSNGTLFSDLDPKGYDNCPPNVSLPNGMNDN